MRISTIRRSGVDDNKPMGSNFIPIPPHKDLDNPRLERNYEGASGFGGRPWTRPGFKPESRVLIFRGFDFIGFSWNTKRCLH